MTFMDYLLLILAAGVLIYQLNLLIKIKKTVIIPGTPPNRKVLIILVAAILVLAFIRSSSMARTWPVLLITGLACAMIFVGGSGLSLEGMYSGGRYLAFKQAEYYSIDTNSKEGLTFRLAKLTRECSMLIREEQQAEILKLMEENRIPTFEEYQKKMRKRVETRAQASQRKKKKK